MNPLKIVGGVSIQQAAELLGVPVGKIMKNISSGLLESISFGAGGVDGVTSESVKNLIRMQAEKDLFQRKTIERAHKSWIIFADFFLNEGGRVKLRLLYGVYEKWTRREGMMTLSKVELGDYLVDIKGHKEEWENEERVIVGVSLKTEIKERKTPENAFLQAVLDYLKKHGELVGGMGPLGKLFGITGAKFTREIDKIIPELEELGWKTKNPEKKNRTAGSKRNIEIRRESAERT